MKELLEQYENSLVSDPDRSRQQAKRIRQRIEHLVCDVMNADKPDDITAGAVVSCINDTRQKVSKRYAYLQERELLGFLSWLAEKELINQDILSCIRPVTPDPYGCRFFSREELEKVEQALPLLPVSNVFRFCRTFELKPSYAYPIALSDLDLDNRCLIAHRKLVRDEQLQKYVILETGEETIHHLPEDAVSILRDQVEKRKAMNAADDDLLFTDHRGRCLTPVNMHSYNLMLQMLSGVNDVTLQALITDHKYKRITGKGEDA